MKRIIILLSVIAIFLISGCRQQTEELVGGPCTYDTFDGQCKIVSVQDMNVKFRFVPNSDIKSAVISDEALKEKEFEYYAMYLGLKCLDNIELSDNAISDCGIVNDSSFDCQISLITSGTCNPITFKFI